MREVDTHWALSVTFLPHPSMATQQLYRQFVCGHILAKSLAGEEIPAVLC
jgi:hypothetical protein